MMIMMRRCRLAGEKREVPIIPEYLFYFAWVARWIKCHVLIKDDGDEVEIVVYGSGVRKKHFLSIFMLCFEEINFTVTPWSILLISFWKAMKIPPDEWLPLFFIYIHDDACVCCELLFLKFISLCRSAAVINFWMHGEKMWRSTE